MMNYAFVNEEGCIYEIVQSCLSASESALCCDPYVVISLHHQSKPSYKTDKFPYECNLFFSNHVENSNNKNYLWFQTITDSIKHKL